MNITSWRWEFLRRRSNYRQDWEKSYPPSLLLIEPVPTIRLISLDIVTQSFRLIIRPSGLECRMHWRNIISAGCRTRRLPNLMLTFNSNHGRMYSGQGPDWLEEREEINLPVSEWRVAALFDLKKSLPAQMKKNHIGSHGMARVSNGPEF